MSNIGMSNVRLLQIVSPTLPTGAFAYSQGLEWAVECGWVRCEKDTRDWLESTLHDTIKHLELPILARLYQASLRNDREMFHKWSHWLYSNRETSELRDEEKQRARAMLGILNNLPGSESWPELTLLNESLLKCQLGSYALAATKWHIDKNTIMQGYAWSWLENAVAAAIKLVPLGQTEGQRLLFDFGSDLSNVVHDANTVSDHHIGASAPALAIASSLHETQYSRLFRS